MQNCYVCIVSSINYEIAIPGIDPFSDPLRKLKYISRPSHPIGLIVFSIQ